MSSEPSGRPARTVRFRGGGRGCGGASAAALLALCGLAAAACDETGWPPPPAARSTPRALAGVVPTTATFHDPASGLAFETDEPVRVTAEHFAVTDPATFHTTMALSDPERRALVSIDVWRNADRLPLPRWIERYLAYVLDESSVADWRPLSRHAAPGLLVERPRTPQAFGRRIAVVAVGESVVRLTCNRTDDVAAVALFERVLETLQLREVRR